MFRISIYILVDLILVATFDRNTAEEFSSKGNYRVPPQPPLYHNYENPSNIISGVSGYQELRGEAKQSAFKITVNTKYKNAEENNNNKPQPPLRASPENPKIYDSEQTKNYNPEQHRLESLEQTKIYDSEPTKNYNPEQPRLASPKQPEIYKYEPSRMYKPVENNIYYPKPPRLASPEKPKIYSSQPSRNYNMKQPRIDSYRPSGYYYNSESRLAGTKGENIRYEPPIGADVNDINTPDATTTQPVNEPMMGPVPDTEGSDEYSPITPPVNEQPDGLKTNEANFDFNISIDQLAMAASYSMCCTGGFSQKTLSCQPCKSKDKASRNERRSCICPKGTIEVPKKTENATISNLEDNDKDSLSDYFLSLYVLEKSENSESSDTLDTESSKSLDLENVFQDYGACHRKLNSHEIICPKPESNSRSG